MATPFPHARFLQQLESPDATAAAAVPLRLKLLLPKHGLADGGSDSDREASGIDRTTPAAVHLMALLHARRAMLQAASDTTQVADALRRYQKFARPGPPSTHIVQLRQQQAAARQASSQSRLALVRAASAFVREAGISVPARVAMETFITQWIASNVPRDDDTGD